MSKKPNNASPAGGSKKQRQQRIRELARQERERQERHERRVRWAWQGGIGAVIIVIIAVVTLVIVNSVKPGVTAAGPKNMISDGFVVKGENNKIVPVKTKAMPEGGTPTPTDFSAIDDAVSVVVYLDYMCPICGQFEQANGEMLSQLVASGDIVLELRPLSFLDRMSQGTEYSTRAANAMAAVANYQPEKFMDANTALFVNQPSENTSGLTDDEIWSILQSAGVDNENVKKAIDDQTFAKWVAESTQRSFDENVPYVTGDDAKPVSGTPTVVVDGKFFEGNISDSSALQAAIQQAAGGDKSGDKADDGASKDDDAKSGDTKE